MDNLLIFLINWSPTIIWISLCVFGIIYAFKEISECKDDINAIEKNKDSYKYIVATGNVKNSRRSIYIQLVFLSSAALTTYFKIQEPIQYPDSLIRALLVPALFISAELCLVLNLREQSSTRKKIRVKVREKLNKENNEQSN